MAAAKRAGCLAGRLAWHALELYIWLDRYVPGAQSIAGMLPSILGHVRLLWCHSSFYSNPDRITGLLRKVSDEVINRCCSVISLPAVFAGACADGVMEALQVCHKLHRHLTALPCWWKECRTLVLPPLGRTAPRRAAAGGRCTSDASAQSRPARLGSPGLLMPRPSLRMWMLSCNAAGELWTLGK